MYSSTTPYMYVAFIITPVFVFLRNATTIHRDLLGTMVSKRRTREIAQVEITNELRYPHTSIV